MASIIILSIYLATQVFASDATVSIEPEERTLTSPAVVGNDSTASGRKFVQFSAESSNASTDGRLWIDPAVLQSLPTSGAEWDAVMGDANALPSDGSGANIADQHSGHDQLVMAAALVCARTGIASYCNKAQAGVLNAIGTEDGAHGLAIGRNLGAYVIAADLLGLRADDNPDSDGSRVDAWIRSFLTREFGSNISNQPAEPLTPFGSGSNASAQLGFVYSAIAAYAKDDWALSRAWDAFRTYVCDPTAPNRKNINITKGIQFGWAHNDDNPCAVNPRGTTKTVPKGQVGAGQTVRIDGAIINDMRRGGKFQHPPKHTRYPWVGQEGFVPAALILHRAGFPAFEVADQAIKRSFDYLWWLHTEVDPYWWTADRSRRAEETKHLVNTYYGTSYPVVYPIGGGRTFGYTGWSHPTASSINSGTTGGSSSCSSGGQVTATVNVPTSGTYRVWSRIMAPNGSDNSYYLSINSTECGTVVGDTSIPANTWTWIDYQAGISSSKYNVTLSAGNHALRVSGREAGVKVDRILFLSDTSCVPVGNGDNCLISAEMSPLSDE